MRATTGGPIADAEIALTNGETGVTLEVRTDRLGRFLLSNVPLGGPYLLTARRIGYRSSRQGGFRMVLGERREVVIALEPATVELAPIEVSGDAGRERADRAGGSVRIDLSQLRTIPTPNRDFTDLGTLSSAVGPQLSIAGQRYTATGFSLDGVQSRNQLRAGTYNGGPYAISLEEIGRAHV